MHLGLRALLHWLLRRRIALPAAEPLLLPLREAANFALWLGSLFGRRVRWGDNVMLTGGGLTMHREPTPLPEPGDIEQASCCNCGGQA